MNVLPFGVKDHDAAVVVATGKIKPVLPQLLEDNLFAEKPQISGDDQVVVLRAAMEILKMLPDSVDGSGRHRSSHVVCVLDAEILNFSDGRALNERSFAAS